MFNVYQPWDPLRVCVVGRTYGPEFYSWIENPSIREKFEKIAVESEEDLQSLIAILKRFNVEVLRPTIPKKTLRNGVHALPPLIPRDHIAMIGNVCYENQSFDFKSFYNNVRDPSWPNCTTLEDFFNLPMHIQTECIDVHKLWEHKEYFSSYNHIIEYVQRQGNAIKSNVRTDLDICNRAQILPAGQDYFVGTWHYNERPAWKTVTLQQQQKFIDQEFPYTRNHIVNTLGHLDSSFSIIKPGLILSDQYEYNLQKYFPDWEIVKFPANQSILSNREKFSIMGTFKIFNQNLRTYSYLIPGFDHNEETAEFVENHLSHWLGNSIDTKFEIGSFVIDEQNIVVFGEEPTAIKAFERHGMTVHPVNFRHAWFWDNGIHCITSDLHREGTVKNLRGVAL